MKRTEEAREEEEKDSNERGWKDRETEERKGTYVGRRESIRDGKRTNRWKGRIKTSEGGR